jgi:PAS domain S-box-containing protein
VLAYAGLYVLWTAFPWELGRYTDTVNALADYPAMIAAAALMLRASSAVTSQPIRRGWRLLAAGYCALVVANGTYDYISLVEQRPSFPSVGDLFFLAFFPLALSGLLSFPGRLGSRAEKLIFGLDASTVMVGGGLVLLEFVLMPVAGNQPALRVALCFYYPIADMVLALCVGTVLLRQLPSHTRQSMNVLIVGFIVMFVSDLTYSHDVLEGTYVGTRVTDSLWTVSYAIMALGAHLQQRAALAAGGRTAEPPAPREFSSLLPVAAICTSLGVLFIVPLAGSGMQEGTLRIGLALLLALVGARQLIAARENVRILAERATRATEARFKALVQQSSDLIVIVERDGLMRYLSPSSARVLGERAEALEGTRITALAEPGAEATVAGFLERVARDAAAPLTAVWRLRHASGRWIHVEVVGSNRLAEPSIGGIVLNARDVSERVELEAEQERTRRDLEAYQAQLQQSQKMEAVGRLAGGIAHDMNNTLAAIVATADCLAQEATDDAARADAEAILSSARRAADLTRNLLGFSRRGAFRSEVIRPESLVTSVLDMVARTLPKGIKVETSFGDELAAFDGDPSQFHHALLNLCINAADAMSASGVLTLGAHLSELDEVRASALGLSVGRHVVLSVRDTGTGMDEATRQHLFEPFFTTKDVGRGTGLGLAMVYGTVKRHAGGIEVDSAPGAGTTFRIYLPVSTRSAAPASSPSPRPQPGDAPQAAGRVLVVDDEPLLRSTVQRILEKRGYAVTVAAHGGQGLELLEQAAGQFDVVLLDMAMPVMAGPEMFRRARMQYPELRVLLTSGYTSSDDAQALLREGALGLVNKPFTPAHLVEAVASVQRGRRVEAADVTPGFS